MTAKKPELLAHLPKDLYDSDFLRFKEASWIKTLGIKWNAISDSFSYNFAPLDQSTKITKRQILSAVANLFDPSVWLAPIVIHAKVLLQQLWLEGLEWDKGISKEFLKKWNDLVLELSQQSLFRGGFNTCHQIQFKSIAFVILLKKHLRHSIPAI